MKQILISFFIFISVNVFPYTFCLYNPVIIYLNIESGIDKGKQHRSLPCAVIKDNVITFDAFDEDCSMQIVDVDNDLVIHEEFIFSGDTECMLPVLSSGNYKVKFVGYETVYSGYFEIR